MPTWHARAHKRDNWQEKSEEGERWFKEEHQPTNLAETAHDSVYSTPQLVPMFT
jgi:hypothetical protein